MISNSNKQYSFSWTEKCVSTSRDEELLEKYMSQWKKMVARNEFLLARIKSVFKKWFPLISVTVLPNRKELSSKVDGFQ